MRNSQVQQLAGLTYLHISLKPEWRGRCCRASEREASADKSASACCSSGRSASLRPASCSTGSIRCAVKQQLRLGPFSQNVGL